MFVPGQTVSGQVCLDPRVCAQNKPVRSPDGKQPIANHPGNLIDLLLQVPGVEDLQVIDVHNVIAVVGNTPLSIHRVSSQ